MRSERPVRGRREEGRSGMRAAGATDRGRGSARVDVGKRGLEKGENLIHGTLLRFSSNSGITVEGQEV